MDLSGIRDVELKTFYSLFLRRKSIREYSNKPVEEEKINRLLEILRLSQSAANCQPWYFIVVKRGDNISLDKVFYKDGFKTSPLVIVACANPTKAWVRKEDNRNYSWVDVSIALTDMITAATAEGLGTCWVASFDVSKARQIFNIPLGIDIVALITIGYPKSPLIIEKKYRKELVDIIKHSKWE